MKPKTPSQLVVDKQENGATVSVDTRVTPST
jgi:hypothetical protein